MPGLGTLAKQIADAREGLVAVKKQIKEEAVSRATVAELEEAQQKSTDLETTLKVHIQGLEGRWLSQLKKSKQQKQGWTRQLKKSEQQKPRLRHLKRSLAIWLLRISGSGHGKGVQ